MAEPGFACSQSAIAHVRLYAGMGHYPGWWWSATTGALVGYESLLERDRVVLADFDRGVVAIASQPVRYHRRRRWPARRNVPDYMLRLADRAVLLELERRITRCD